ncbi:MAG: Gx transporter family protein [Eubacterium sp.]|nr:Gx transporter family protein [Eubacterium sp.]
MKISVKKLSCAALFTAVSLILFVVESGFPPIIPIPGVKIGLAYLPIMLIIFIGGGWKTYDGVLVLVARVLLSALITGNPTALLFSVSGAVLASAVMWCIKLLVKDASAVIFAGALAAAAHNIGQLAAASLIYGAGVWTFLPFLLIFGIISGLFGGIVIFLLIRKPLKPITMIKNIEG